MEELEVDVDRPYEDLPDERLESRLTELARDDEALRQLPRRFKADAHAAIDRSVEAARSRLAERLSVFDLAHSGGTPVIPSGIGDDYTLVFAPEVAALWHSRLDATESRGEAGDSFATLDRPEFEARRRAIADEVQAIEREQAIRKAQRQQAAAEQELTELGRTT